MTKIHRIFSMPKFFSWVVMLFLAQALMFIGVVSISTPIDGVGGRYVERHEDGVVPDGHRHIGAIYYYAEQSLFSGPVIREMSGSDLWMGDLIRFPSYFYYYLMSFPVRLAMLFSISDTTIVWIIRLIGVLIGVLALIVFRKITVLITENVVVQNISSLALALTGSFVWLSAAENYDMLALLLWLLFAYSSMRLFKYRDAKYIYWMTLWFCFLGIVKYTYVPFAVMLGSLAVIMYIKYQSAYDTKSMASKVILDLRVWLDGLAHWQILAGSIAVVCALGLFTERITGNIVMYQSFNPDCVRIHSQEDCMNFGVYARNYTQKQNLANGTVEEIEYTSLGYSAYWVRRYFDSMYAYMGHVYITRYSPWMEATGILAFITGALLFFVAKIRRVRIIRSKEEFFIFTTVILFTFVQYMHNVMIIREYGGQTYAHQGRYLLPIIGFVYLLYFLMIRRAIDGLAPSVRKLIAYSGLIIAAYAILAASAIPSYFYHATKPDWYSDLAQRILPEAIINR